MAFFEVEFPRKLAFASSGGGTTPSGGPGWSTIVNQGFSGAEQRNRNWSLVRNKYQFDVVAQTLSFYQQLLGFWYAVGGKADAFRFYDPNDSQATNQACSPALGDGNNKVFQLQQNYNTGTGPTARQYTRAISKPIQALLQTGGSGQLTDYLGNQLTNTVNMYQNGTKKALGADYTVDATTGLVSFVSAPGNGVAVTADCQYHIPVRFDSDDWPAQIVDSDVKDLAHIVQVVGIQLIEVKIAAGQSQG